MESEGQRESGRHAPQPRRPLQTAQARGISPCRDGRPRQYHSHAPARPPRKNFLNPNRASGTLLLGWADPRRDARYRVWIQIVGTGADFRKADRRDESDATLAGLPAGATVNVKVTAGNDAGEGPASAVVEIKVP